VHIFRTILDWHLVKTGFPGEVQALSGSLISATLQVYTAATQQLLPTPMKSHYLFNLRDFARVVQVRLVLPPTCNSPSASL
jgi:dynein heavy chain